MASYIGRRKFLATLGSAAAAWPATARAQQPAMPVIGILGGQSPQTFAPFLESFRLGLNETGYREGHNLAIESRWAQGRYDRLPDLADVLVSQRVALIFAVGATEAVVAAKSATSTIPIVFATGSDPVKSGLVGSLNRPGGNVTGTTFTALAWRPSGSNCCMSLSQMLASSPCSCSTVVSLPKNKKRAWRRRRMRWGCACSCFPSVANVTSNRLSQSLLLRERTRSLLLRVRSSPRNVRKSSRWQRNTEFPAVYARREHAAAGGLLSYASNVAHMYRRAGVYAGLILNGAKPADLPVELPTKFELVINLKAAKALGLALPDKLLALTDEVIE